MSRVLWWWIALQFLCFVRVEITAATEALSMPQIGLPSPALRVEQTRAASVSGFLPSSLNLTVSAPLPPPTLDIWESYRRLAEASKAAPVPTLELRFSILLLILPISFVLLIFFCTLACSCYGDRRGAVVRTGSFGDGSSQRGYTDRASDIVDKLPTIIFSHHAVSKAATDAEPKVMVSSSRSDLEKGLSKEYWTCTICLTEYEEGETLKAWPSCGHLFHKECIGMWLSSRLTCPLCRITLSEQCSPNLQINEDHVHDQRNDEGNAARITNLDQHCIRSSSMPTRIFASIFNRSSSSSEESFRIQMDAALHTLRAIRRSSSHSIRRDHNRFVGVDYLELDERRRTLRFDDNDSKRDILELAMGRPPTRSEESYGYSHGLTALLQDLEGRGAVVSWERLR
ncbi:hypothetical protein KP509_25G002800 [Ceratopteris richardii]|uniref:RING-type E3 ubiquitin transferase n=1 Tax=Ceratopteris richardii TaxID=49495 RepID=A0A8T2RM79_CERRI|nr:hypothetical protein KP509_25G002800 [Ceratopteris richardii]